MKNFLYVVGAGLVVGSVVTIFCFLNNIKKKNAAEETFAYKNFEDKDEEENGKSSTDVIITQDEPVDNYIKSSAIGSIYSRHKGAATVMRDSVDAIRENIKVSKDTNTEINNISAELDKMISED